MKLEEVRKVLSNFATDFGELSGSDAVFQLGQYFAMYIAAHYSRETGVAGMEEKAAKWAKIASTLSTVRAFGRWAGFFNTSIDLIAFLSQVRQQEFDRKTDWIDQFLTCGQLVSLLAYYPLEHIYYLNEYRLIQVRQPDWYSRASCKAWLVFILLYLAQGVYRLLSQRKLPPTPKLISLTKNVCDLPLAIHWSSEHAVLSNLSVGVLGVAGSLLDVYNRWAPLLSKPE